MLVVALVMAFGWSIRQTDEFPQASASAGAVTGHVVPSLHDGGKPLDSYFLPRSLTLETARVALDGPPPQPRAGVAAAVRPEMPHPGADPAFRWLALAVGDGITRTSPRIPTGPPAA
ncbi:MAG TPA: hypothetical protein VK943_17175 [Arenibaculum sp.]|nr:hypothetical protein [Arenibaculum sp.]